jgi:hypothetical protein
VSPSVEFDAVPQVWRLVAAFGLVFEITNPRSIPYADKSVSWLLLGVEVRSESTGYLVEQIRRFNPLVNNGKRMLATAIHLEITVE